MLLIASQIIIYLLAAALIGFIMGYIVGKGAKKKVNLESSTPIETQKSIEEEVESLIQTVKTEENDAVEIPTSHAIEKATEALESLEKKSEGEEPELMDVAKENKKDALTKIKGIGPKVEAQLNAAGIYHFSQIAAWTEANIQWLERHTNFAHRAKKDLWISQAKQLSQ